MQNILDKPKGVRRKLNAESKKEILGALNKMKEETDAFKEFIAHIKILNSEPKRSAVAVVT
jgi:hypothetical protein